MSITPYDHQFFRLFDLVSSLLPSYQHSDKKFVIPHAITQTPMSFRLHESATPPTVITIFNGRGLLNGHPILLSNWRNQTEQDTSELLLGLKEYFLAPSTASNILLKPADSFIEGGCSVSFFKLMLITADQIDTNDRLIAMIMQSSKTQIQLLIDQIQTLYANTAEHQNLTVT